MTYVRWDNDIISVTMSTLWDNDIFSVTMTWVLWQWHKLCDNDKLSKNKNAMAMTKQYGKRSVTITKVMWQWQQFCQWQCRFDGLWQVWFHTWSSVGILIYWKFRSESISYTAVVLKPGTAMTLPSVLEIILNSKHYVLAHFALSAMELSDGTQRNSVKQRHSGTQWITPAAVAFDLFSQSR